MDHHEGVFGIALGVSTSFVFLFVLFGTLLDKAGAGNWMMQISIALLGHLRGGPAKVAVVSSALNGVVSGSSVSNVVSGGIFTIPLMKRTGLSGVKAGAIEAASSINGQIMPPVMGAAAFLMVEYVGIPYADIVTHAFLPAVMSYVALLYIVHLEALKINAQPIPREAMPARMRLMRTGLGLTGSIVVLCLLYYGVKAVQAGFGASASWVLLLAGFAIYVATVAYAARHPDLELDDPNAPIIQLPRAWDVTRTGIDFLIPIVVLLWCLMVEEMSPGLSAFWATVAIIGIVATRRPLLAMFRRQNVGAAFRAALGDLTEGFALGARNMIGIAIATATAGIVVGTGDAHGPRAHDDRVRGVHLRRQRDHHAGAHRRGEPHPRHGHPDDRELHPGRHAHGAGGRGARCPGRARDPAHRRPPLRLLFRDHGGHHPARGACVLRGGGDLAGGPDRDGLPGRVLRAAHRGAALRVHLQPADAPHRRGELA
jgi:TRAP-type uncharacterized transport system fused permease subunit